MTAGPADPDRVEAFKEAMSRRAGGVAIVALAEEDEIHATTVTSFISVTADPPRVLISLGGNAQVLPFLDEGRRFVVSLLQKDQGRIASVYADTFPVEPSPFAPGGDPVVEGALASFVCTVENVFEPEGARLVVGEVIESSVGEDGRPLIHFRRSYHTLE